MRVAVALSGGVDSSVAAALLKKWGHDVVGITMKIDGHGDADIAAGSIADFLKIEHFVVDLRKSFQKEVVDYFCAEYLAGLTPNPCVRCNKMIKFGVLLEAALDLGADRLATGHYARIKFDHEKKRYLVKKAADPNKDQTYIMYSLTQSQLAKIEMPLGEYTKEEVRTLAHEMELPAANRPESQEICFIPDDDYRSFLRDKTGMDFEPGPFIDVHGEEVGRHQGIPFYTIGQRRGLGLALGKRVYVVGIDPERNIVTVGSEEDIFRDDLLAEDVNFIICDHLDGPMKVEAQVRYNAKPSPAVIEPVGGGGDEGKDDLVKVNFASPQRAVTPGQAIVFYKGDYLVGGGTIRP